MCAGGAGVEGCWVSDPEPQNSLAHPHPAPKSKASRFTHAQPISILEVPEAPSLVLLEAGLVRQHASHAQP